MRTTMPLSTAKSLSAEQHAAVFAYLLRQNGYPAGNEPVQPDVVSGREPGWDGVPVNLRCLLT
jgi:hypothetical protein